MVWYSLESNVLDKMTSVYPSSWEQNTLGSNISNARDNVSSGSPISEKRVENTTLSGVSLTKFEVFG